MRDRLDVHPAFGRDDESNAAGGAVDQQREVEFLRDIDPVSHVETVDLLAGIAGLDRHQRVAEHFLRMAFNFVERKCEPHAALRICGQFLELALAASAGMDLCLDDIQRSGQLFGGSDGFLNRKRGMTVGHGDPVFLEQFLGLVFVDVHLGVIPYSFGGGKTRLQDALGRFARLEKW